MPATRQPATLSKQTRPRGHRFLFQVHGLTNEQAALLYKTLTDTIENNPHGTSVTARSNVPISVLRKAAPGDQWFIAPAPCKLKESK